MGSRHAKLKKGVLYSSTILEFFHGVIKLTSSSYFCVLFNPDFSHKYFHKLFFPSNKHNSQQETEKLIKLKMFSFSLFCRSLYVLNANCLVVAPPSRHPQKSQQVKNISGRKDFCRETEEGSVQLKYTRTRRK